MQIFSLVFEKCHFWFITFMTLSVYPFCAKTRYIIHNVFNFNGFTFIRKLKIPYSEQKRTLKSQYRIEVNLIKLVYSIKLLYCGTIKKWRHRKISYFSPSLPVINISKPLPLLATEQKVTECFEINYPQKWILGSLSYILITQYPLPDFHSQTVKCKNITYLNFMALIKVHVNKIYTYYTNKHHFWSAYRF